MGNALEFSLTADGVGFNRTIDAAQKKLAGLGSKVSGDLKSLVGGAVSYEAFKHLVSHTVEATKRIHDLSKQSDVSTDEMQRLDKAAGKVGLSFEDYQGSLTKLGSARREAAQSNQELLAFFNEYGITLDELQDPQIKNIDLMKRLAAAIPTGALSMGDMDALQDIFGVKAVDKVLAGMRELAKMGPAKIIAAEDVQAIYELDRSITKLKKDWQKVSAPTMGRVAEAISNSFSGENGYKARGRVMGKLTDGELPDFSELAGAGMESLLDDATLKWVLKKLRGEEGGFDGSPLPMPKGKGKGTLNAGAAAAPLNEVPVQEQFRRMYDFLDREAQLIERVKKVRFDMLSPMEQQADLQRRINDELEKAKAAEGKGDNRNALFHKENAMDLNEQLKGTIHPVKAPGADASTQAGGFIKGAAGSEAAARYYQDSLGTMRQIEDNTRMIAEKVGLVDRVQERAWNGL